ncbi:AMP-binding protein [Fulvivirgaceae bacterium BMA12]|uniref:AMP-binding protein n=1 Tax=Agaribacillus aureus TaxID=3051825 RepID=A0ABT8LCS5_9BACT|nr:AMP-binding protein [Fulvivirgaceae bacterium BMA12]
MPDKEKYLELNGQKILLADLQHFELEEMVLSAFEKDTLSFIQSWLRGEGYFTVPTSGSTGKPKDIEIPRSAMEHSAHLTGNALKLATGDRALACINTAYIGGKMMLARALILGMDLTVVTPSSNPFATIEPGRYFDFIALVPLQLETLLAEGGGVNILNQAKAIIVGGAAVSEQLKQKMQVIDAPIYATYGMTETVSHIALKKLNGPDGDQHFKVFDEMIIGQDERDCLTIQSKLTGGNTIITNDRVRIISSHEFEWLGRIDNVVNTGGVKVQVEQLEFSISSILTGLGRNENFMVGAVDDQRLGQKLILLLEGPESPEDALLDQLKKQLAFHAPREIKWIKEFSRTATGKINRGLTMKKLRGK